MQNEIWQDIKGFEGFYQISSFGRIKSFTKSMNGRILKHIKGKRGYYTIGLRSKTLTVHRLVALTFIPNPDNKPCVNHIDGNKLNNRINNLEWVTITENNRHARKLGLNNNTGWTSEKNPNKGKFGYKNHSSKPVFQYDLNGNLLNHFGSIKQAEKKTGCNNSEISKVCRGIYKQTGGYIWRYQNES